MDSGPNTCHSPGRSSTSVSYVCATSLPRVIVGWSTTVMWPWLSAVADDTQGKDASVPYVLLVMVVFLIYAL